MRGDCYRRDCRKDEGNNEVETLELADYEKASSHDQRQER